MRKTIAAAALSASLLGGGAVGTALFVPAIASAQTSTDSGTTATDGTAAAKTAWMTDALQSLVDDGTITQAQADAVGAKLAAARPERGPHRGGGPARLAVAASAIGIDESALRDALQAGDSIAEVATANGVDPQVVIDALVADLDARLAAKVAAGTITQAEADERRADAATRIADQVQNAGPLGGPRGGPRLGG
jgi:hypothetical protein